jgi:hypothetical protein
LLQSLFAKCKDMRCGLQCQPDRIHGILPGLVTWPGATKLRTTDLYSILLHPYSPRITLQMVHALSASTNKSMLDP